ncbi:HAD family phosphatase [Salinibaculum salinum]|uniref:HAD family hydrolase n=1 Tax=Salinibaculum salinum TaxID=3131996 RepID=UPI0030EE6CEF
MDAVCFDMDGVVVNSEDFWVPRETAELFPELVPDAAVDVEEITGMNYRDIYDYLDETYGVERSRDEFLAWYDEAAESIYEDDVNLLDGTRQLVDTLRERGVAVALVSSSPHHWIAIVLERFGLDFDEVVSADAVDVPGKPSPDIYEHTADLLGVEPASAIAVEDSGHGIGAASAAGMHVVGFKHGDPDDTDRSAADYVASSPSDLREHLLARTA